MVFDRAASLTTPREVKMVRIEVLLEQQQLKIH